MLVAPVLAVRLDASGCTVFRFGRAPRRAPRDRLAVDAWHRPRGATRFARVRTVDGSFVAVLVFP